MHVECRLGLGRRRRSGRLRILDLRGSRHPENQQSNEKKQGLCPNRLCRQRMPLGFGAAASARIRGAESGSRRLPVEGGAASAVLDRSFAGIAQRRCLPIWLMSSRARARCTAVCRKATAVMPACISRIPVSA